MPKVEDILKKLNSLANKDLIDEMTRDGIPTQKRIGVSIPEITNLAKEIGDDHEFALELWKTEIPEARILAAFIDVPEKLTLKQMENWVKDFDSWDICDQVCMKLFDKTPLAWKKILDWSQSNEEFIKRASFTLIACLALHDEIAEDKIFIDLMPLLKVGALDNRNHVKKAISWALRNIGKRNLNLNKAAIVTAKKIQEIELKSAHWIAADVIKELESKSVQEYINQ